MKTIEQRLRNLERMMLEIHAHLVLGKPVIPSMEEFDEAIEALTHGDQGPMDEYLARGGKIPDPEPETRRSTSRRRAVRPVPAGEPTNGCGPVMLPGKERGASSVSSTANL